MRRAFRSLSIVALATLTSAALADAPSAPCPKATDLIRVFPEGLGQRSELNVNPDGAVASYTPGNHGYTYIANGLNLIAYDGKHNPIKIGCSLSENTSLCMLAFTDAEAKNFGPRTAEFCVFAMEVEPIPPAKEVQHCEGADSGRAIAGNGKGRIKRGAPFPSFAGGMGETYQSTTSLRHLVGGEPAYLDSAIIPTIVAPGSLTPSPLGAVAWVRYRNQEWFAVVGDTGPGFQEGSIALHQLLRYGALQPPQSVGPIPAAKRCAKRVANEPIEADLKRPFGSYPDGGKGDRCHPNATTQSDIRAYQGFDPKEGDNPEDGKVDIVVLTSAMLPVVGRVIQGTVSQEMLAKRAHDAGITTERLRAMADCLKGP